jgi:Ca2+-binding RTX toxin-like protein
MGATRVAAVVVAATLAVGGLGAPAFAAATGVASVSATTRVTVTAGSAKVNSFTISRSGDTITVDDVVALNPGAGCRRVGTDTTRVSCALTAAPTLLTVAAGDLADKVNNTTNVPMTATGGAGDDAITGGSAGDTVDGGTGNDRISGAAGPDALTGGAGDDILSGGTFDDVLLGGLGDDTLLGGADFDTVTYRDRTVAVVADLDGATGDDGQAGEKDTISADVEAIAGGAGDDTLTGNGSPNVLGGGAGDDTVRGGDMDDILRGGAGVDAIYGDAGGDDIQGGAGDDGIRGGSGDDVISGDEGADTVYGEAGRDSIQGDADADTLRGGDGQDHLYGGAGNDLVYGEAADDFLWGNGGPVGDVDTETDVLDGAAGVDRCVAGTLGTKVACE